MAISTSFKIVGIIQREKQETICFDTSYKTYSEAMRRSTPNLNLIVVCERKTTKTSYIFIDLAKFLTVFQLCVVSWINLLDEIKLRLTDPRIRQVYTYSPVPSVQYFKRSVVKDGVVKSYVYTKPTPFDSNITDRPFIFSYNYNNYVSAGYVNINAPRIRNKKNRKTTLPDLVFKNLPGSLTDLKNTLVSVNGVVGYPIYDKKSNELFVKNGAHMLRDVRDDDQNIVFLDFSKILPEESSTEIKHWKLSDCHPDVVIRKDDKVILTNGGLVRTNSDGTTKSYLWAKNTLETFLNHDVEFWRQFSFTLTFAVKVEETEYSQFPVLCFGGRMFIPGIDNLNYYFIKEEDVKYMVVELSATIPQIVNILASNLQHAGIFYGLSTLYRAAVGYIISNVYTDKSFNWKHSSSEWRAIEYATQFDIPFVTVVQTDKYVSFNKVSPISIIKPNVLRFPRNTQGILFNRKTKEIIDYTRLVRRNDTIVSITPRDPLYISKKEGAVAHINIDGSTTTNLGALSTQARLNVFPSESVFEFSFMLKNCYIARSNVTGKIYGKTVSSPVQKDGLGNNVAYTWSSLNANVEDCQFFVGANTMYLGEKEHPTYIAINASENADPTTLTWWKVLDIDSSSLQWEVYTTPLEIPDSLRYEQYIWKQDPIVFIDQFNQYHPGELLKDIQAFDIVDILYAPLTPATIEDDPSIIKPDDEEPEEPVYTIEYEKVTNKPKKFIKPILVTTTIVMGDNGPTVSTDYLRVIGLTGNLEGCNGYYTKSGTTWSKLINNTVASIQYNTTKGRWELVLLSDPAIEVVWSNNTTITEPYDPTLTWVANNSTDVIIDNNTNVVDHDGNLVIGDDGYLDPNFYYEIDDEGGGNTQPSGDGSLVIGDDGYLDPGFYYEIDDNPTPTPPDPSSGGGVVIGDDGVLGDDQFDYIDDDEPTPEPTPIPTPSGGGVVLGDDGVMGEDQYDYIDDEPDDSGSGTNEPGNSGQSGSDDSVDDLIADNGSTLGDTTIDDIP